MRWMSLQGCSVMARETRLWSWLKDGTKHLPYLHMRRVENLVSEGDPDVDGCHQGVYFEAELKGCDRPARGGKLGFEVRRSQVLWHRRRWKAGGNLWLYIRVGFGKDVARYLVPGNLTGQIFEGVTEADLVRMSVLPPKHTPVEALQAMLAGRQATAPSSTDPLT